MTNGLAEKDVVTALVASAAEDQTSEAATMSANGGIVRR